MGGFWLVHRSPASCLQAKEFYNHMSDKQFANAALPGFLPSQSPLFGLFSLVVTAIVAGDVVSVTRGFTYV
jgi:hypothetical protein